MARPPIRTVPAIEQQRAAERAAEEAARDVTAGVLDALDGLGDDITIADVEREVAEIQKARAKLPVKVATKRIQRAINDTLAGGIKVGRNLAARHLPKSLGERAPAARALAALESKAAAKWAEKRAAKLAASMSREAQRVTRAAIADGVKRGLSPTAITREVKLVIRLDERGAKAVANFRAAQEAQGLGPRLVAQRVTDYADRLALRRAELISLTETQGALNHGRTDLWRSMVDDGLIKEREIQRTWVTQRDDAVDEICDALDGETATLNGSFPGGAEPGAVHPMCRCSATFEVVSA